MKILTIAVLGLLIIGCAKNTDPLVVKMQTVRDQNTLSKEDPMVDHEKAVRLYGAVSMQERRQRLGQYYTVLWNADAGVNKEISFEYQQGNSDEPASRKGEGQSESKVTLRGAAKAAPLFFVYSVRGARRKLRPFFCLVTSGNRKKSGTPKTPYRVSNI
jgi:hypothetical protein